MALGRPTKKRQKLSDLIVEHIKRWIVAEGKKPGDKLPNEKELIELFGYSKSTVREALKALEVRGMISIRTGPGGGAYLQQVTLDHASEPLRNFLHFHHLDGRHVYQLRKLLEPELAVSVVGRISDDQMRRLEENVRLCQKECETEDDLRERRVAELEFHNILVESCANPVLGFMCRFLNDLIRDLVVYKNTLDHQHFGESNLDFHVQLLDAFRTRDVPRVHELMRAHMVDAECHLAAMEAELGVNRLLLPASR